MRLLALLLILPYLSSSVICWNIPYFDNVKITDAVCLVTECCRSHHIPADFQKLENTLKEKVYGQHLVENAVNALRSHFQFDSSKALALSFHGWPGSGKNYVSKFIAESIYKYGQKSQFVHHFIGRIHFPVEAHSQKYQEELYSWLKGNITRCPRQLFIFDEVDKMPPQVLNAVKPMIDYREVVDGVDYTQAVFIFLSNTGAQVINEQYLHLWKKGIKRDDLRLTDFESLITKGAFNEEGGFHHSDTIKSNLIDHYIPFLPMEHSHIESCILDEFKQRGVQNPRNEHVREVLDFIEWGPDPERLFSKTGCKRISSKVGTLVVKHYKPRQEL